MSKTRWRSSPARASETSDGTNPAAGSLHTQLTTARNYLDAMRVATGYRVYTWDIATDQFSDDSQLDELVGAAMDEHPGNALEQYFALVHPDDREAVRASALGALVEGGPDYRSEHRIIVPSSNGPHQRWVSTVARAQFDEHGVPTRLVGVQADITERRHQEEARVRQQKLDAIGTLATGLAHDFNNLIGAIRSNAQMAQLELRTDQSPTHSIDEIDRAAQRAAELVQRLLTCSRDEPPQRIAFYLCDVLEEAAALMRPVAGSHIPIELTYPPDLPPMFGDPGQLHQVVVNLISNAAQALSGGAGLISLTLDEIILGERRPAVTQSLDPGTYLRLRAGDDGPGIDAAVINRIFDPFFTTKPTGQGTGMGLAAVQGIIRSHRGAITAESSPGHGATFTLYLPIPEGSTSGLTRGPVSEQEPVPATAHVLFVDDEPALTSLARRAMPHCGCTVAAFLDPSRALSAFTENPDDFDAVITDLAMPGLSGIELATRVRELRPRIPIVLTSGHMKA